MYLFISPQCQSLPRRAPWCDWGQNRVWLWAASWVELMTRPQWRYIRIRWHLLPLQFSTISLSKKKKQKKILTAYFLLLAGTCRLPSRRRGFVDLQLIFRLQVRQAGSLHGEMFVVPRTAWTVAAAIFLSMATWMKLSARYAGWQKWKQKQKLTPGFFHWSAPVLVCSCSTSLQTLPEAIQTETMQKQKPKMRLWQIQ